jgi:hypothetical protein
MYHDVKRRFEEEITKRLSLKPEVLKFVLNHERKDVCLKNLCEQIEKCERQSFQILFDAKKYASVIKSVAVLFAKAVILHKEEKMMTEGARLKQISDHSKMQRAEEYMIDLENEAFRVADESEKTEFDRIKHEREIVRIAEEIQAEQAAKSERR